MPIWEGFQGAITGQVALLGSPAHEELAKPFNARFHEIRPQAVVLCASPRDVSETISFARRHGLETAIRSGGHCFAANSSTRGIVIDVSQMRSVSVSGRVAKIGAGAQLGHVYEALQEHDLTIPAGTCPSVGVAGLTLGGGMGILGRKYGVTSDRLIGAQIVLADGRSIECDETHHADLFWALRGAGAGIFGVVTSLVFQTISVPSVTNFHLAWPHSQAVAVIEAWQRWAPTGPDELAASLKVTATGAIDQLASVDVYGALLGTESAAIALLDELVVLVGSPPSSVFHKHMSFLETRRFWADLGADDGEARRGPHLQAAQHAYLSSKSEFFRRPLPTEAILALVQAFASVRAKGESRELDFMPWGGAYNRVPADATAFVHRDELFQLKHAVVVDSQASTSEKDAAHRWVARSWGSVHAWGSGRVFQNFADPDLVEWPTAYYGTNLERLTSIKTRYDPDDFFRFAQSIGQDHANGRQSSSER